MKDLSNLGWPEAPFGSVTRPVQKPGSWLTAVSMIWADAGEEPIIMGAAAVFLQIHRTRSLPVTPSLAHFGYRVLVPETLDENIAILTRLDTILVQARREAQVIAWHHAVDDLHLLCRQAEAVTDSRYPGVSAIAEAWQDRGHREPSTARCVDTALDLGPNGLVSDTAVANDLTPMPQFAGMQQQTRAQHACEALVEDRYADYAPEMMAVNVLSSALMTGLLGGLQAERLHWDAPLVASDLLENVAWDIAPSVLGGVVTPQTQ
ncbi:hypothetical protein [Streptomyces sp. 769]|uniref:hypothetical protein n=1 Tax=Streptomyces sp. 769 TaxID=1262452 RepID=UPI00057EA129|nr:hypothetical protein [Streptomyces sp. 769]AJC58585.1 hypothetical protein GZL_06012 [Streptomyces sp. 769]